MKKQRIAAIIACFILMAVTFLSLFYIEKELNHDCTGEDCAVCICIHQAEAVLKNIGNGVSLSIHAINICYSQFVSEYQYVLFLYLRFLL